jgi:hypothetical protein
MLPSARVSEIRFTLRSSIVRRGALAFAAACALLCPPVWAQERVRLIGVTASGDAVASSVELIGDRPLSFTTLKLREPPRVVVDFAETELSGVPRELAVDDGTIRRVAVAAAGQKTARVVIELAGDADFDVRAHGNRVEVRVPRIAPLLAKAEPPEPPKPPKPAPALPTVALVGSGRANPAPAPAAPVESAAARKRREREERIAAYAAAQRAAAEKVAAARKAAREKHLALAEKAKADKRAAAEKIAASREAARERRRALAQKAEADQRAAADKAAAGRKARALAAADKAAADRQARALAAAEKAAAASRAVAEKKRPAAEKGEARRTAATAAADRRARAAPPQRKLAAAGARDAITGIGFRPVGDGQVIVHSNQPLAYRVSGEDNVVLVHMPSAAIPLPNNRRPLDTRFFNGPVQRVVPVAVGVGTDLRIELRGHPAYQLVQSGTVLTVTFSGPR